MANNCVHLRKYRRLSQTAVANRMQTSQPKVARIESGDENITLKTLKRIIAALEGRLRLSIEPAELTFPPLPTWWDSVEALGAQTCSWTIRKYMVGEAASGRKVALAAWASEAAGPAVSELQLRDQPISSAIASGPAEAMGES